MDQNSVGTTLVSGIQDISAFLPIIGTEQCERHIGSALDGGFMYAAATPLSMFGSLGIIKGSIAVLCASTHSKLAQMLSDAGFKLEGSAAAMIGKVPRGEKEQAVQEASIPYVAARQFHELLKKQHIKNDVSRLSLVYTYRWWNVSLILMTVFLSAFGIIPYIPIIVEHHSSSKPVPIWFYPLLRIIGSVICIITVQFIIQIRTETILNDALLKLKEEDIGQKSSENDEPSKTSKITGSADRKVHDPENGSGLSSQDLPREATLGRSQDPVQEHFAEVPVLDDHDHSKPSKEAKQQKLSPPPPAKSKRTFIHLYLFILQMCLFLGIGATGVGYVGCFTVIQSTASTKNTYLWLALEGILAVLRIILWGSNPKWDGETGVMVNIALTTTEPLITTPESYRRKFSKDAGWSYSAEKFMIIDNAQFLNHLTPYTGPLERFNDPDHHVAIYYTLFGMAQINSKVLLTTVLDLETQSTFVLEHQSGRPDSKPIVYPASFEVLKETGIPVVTFKVPDRLDELHRFTKKDLLHRIHQHSQKLMVHIAGGDRISRLDLSWTISHQSTSNSSILQSSPLSQIVMYIHQFLDVLLHHTALPSPERATELQPKIAALTDADKKYMAWNRNVCRAKIAACGHRAMLSYTTTKILAIETIADLSGDPVPEQYAKDFTHTCSFLEMLAKCESEALELWVLLEYQKLASNIPMHSNIFADAWSVGLANRRKAFQDRTDQRISKYKDLPLISPDALMPWTIQQSIKDFVGSIHVDDHSITPANTSSIAQQLKELSKFNMNILNMFFSHQEREAAQMVNRVMHVFKEGINLENNKSSLEIISAEYVKYPVADNENMIQIMLRRQLTVYDCRSVSDNFPDFLEQLHNVPGASLLQLAPELEDEVVSFINTSPTIPIFSIILCEGRTSNPLQHLLQRNRLVWAKQCADSGPVISSFLCFASNFEPNEASMLCIQDGHAILMVHVAKAGPLHLTFLHRVRRAQAVLSLSLLTFGLDFTTLSPSRSTPLPRLKIRPIKLRDTFQCATVEITVEAGYHEISIDVTESFEDDYELRGITTTFATESDENPGQGSEASDGIPEKDDAKSEV
ncbi:hypothetical protein C8J56DRAFT_1171026 [Mycena floridula]|nr:hypothetical protein C8J56DRAFT_1171026 [Mycena floridula]